MISLESIQDVPRHGEDWDEPESIKAHMVQLKALRTPTGFFLLPDDLEKVLRYKLRTQYGRTAKHRACWTESLVRTVTQAAFAVQNQDRVLELQIRTGILTALPGIGVPVASAILAMVAPDRYGIIDFRNWRQLFPDARRGFSVVDYTRYMKKIWSLADQLQWPAQQVDWCIWSYDREKESRSGFKT